MSAFGLYPNGSEFESLVANQEKENMSQYQHLNYPVVDKEDWEGRYRELFDRYMLFLHKIYRVLGMNPQITSESDVLEFLENKFGRKSYE